MWDLMYLETNPFCFLNDLSPYLMIFFFIVRDLVGKKMREFRDASSEADEATDKNAAQVRVVGIDGRQGCVTLYSRYRIKVAKLHSRLKPDTFIWL